jgi:hypothetical protein
MLFDQRGRQVKGWTNKLIWGDNKLILSSLKSGPLRRQLHLTTIRTYHHITAELSKKQEGAIVLTTSRHLAVPAKGTRHMNS